MNLGTLLEAARLTPQQCASLLGVSEGLFQSWLSGQRSIPKPFVDRLSSVLGTVPSNILGPVPASGRLSAEEVAPAVWFKLRSDELTDADRESVFLIRQLGFYFDQLEQATGKVHLGWAEFFEAVRNGVDKQAPPLEQGRLAANALRTSRGLAKGSTGVGDVFRSNLRNIGVLIVESPIPRSRLEGCSFYVGPQAGRPCLFANTYGTTWFRRNTVLLHELGHAIFEAEGGGASIDLANSEDSDFQEARAQAFAEEFLLPQSVLRHLSQARGVDWTSPTPSDVAFLMANSHAEQRLVLAVARKAGLISLEQQEQYASMPVGDELRKVSDHALPLSEYLAKSGRSPSDVLASVRQTTVPKRSLRLPVRYVLDTVEAFERGAISLGKAAELLMAEKQDLLSRFPMVAALAERE